MSYDEHFTFVCVRIGSKYEVHTPQWVAIMNISKLLV